MSRAVDKRAAEESPVARFIHNFLVRALVLNDNQSIPFGMQRQDRKMDFVVENNISLEVTNSLGIGADTGGIVERIQVGVEIEAGLLVKRVNLVTANRTLQLFSVIDSRVPGYIAPRARLELRTKCKNKWKLHLLIPQKLICLLSGEIGWRRLR